MKARWGLSTNPARAGRGKEGNLPHFCRAATRALDTQAARLWQVEEQLIIVRNFAQKEKEGCEVAERVKPEVKFAGILKLVRKYSTGQ